MNDVRIFEISNGGYSGPRWLCPRHVAERSKKWSVKPGASVPHDLTCDDCLREAPTDNRPVAFAPNRAESRLPPPEVVARQPGTTPMKPWAVYMADLKAATKERRRAA